MIVFTVTLAAGPIGAPLACLIPTGPLVMRIWVEAPIGTDYNICVKAYDRNIFNASAAIARKQFGCEDPAIAWVDLDMVETAHLPADLGLRVDLYSNYRHPFAPASEQMAYGEFRVSYTAIDASGPQPRMPRSRAQLMACVG